MAKKKFSEFDLITSLTNQLIVGYNPSTLKNVRFAASLLKLKTTLAKTGSYIILDDDGIDRIEVDTTSGDVTITLPTRTDNLGRRIEIAHVKGTNKVIIVADGGESKITSDGLSSVWLMKPGNYIVLQECATSGFWESADERRDNSIKYQESFLDSVQNIGANDLHFMQFTPIRNIIIKSMKTYATTGVVAGDKYVSGIYTDSSGNPSTLIMQSTEVTLSSTHRSIISNLTQPILLLAETPYWFAFHVNRTINFQKGITWDSKYKYKTIAYSATMPSLVSGLSAAGAFIAFTLI